MSEIYNKGIFGAICGDIIGSSYESAGYQTKDLDFELFTPFSRFTDDTVMTCAVAQWLLDDPKHRHKTLVEKMQWLGQEFRNRGYGTMFGQWLDSDNPQPYGSIGNGSAMRVSPCGFYAKTLDEALNLAQISAEVTHNSVEGIAGAQAVAATIFMLRQGKWVDIISNYLSDNFGYNMDRTSEEIASTYQFDVTCKGSVPEAIICALEVAKLKDMAGAPYPMTPRHYIKAVRSAVALGGDADTQAAIAGGIMGALTRVPDDIAERVSEEILDPLLLDIVEDFNRMMLTKS